MYRYIVTSHLVSLSVGHQEGHSLASDLYGLSFYSDRSELPRISLTASEE